MKLLTSLITAIVLSALTPIVVGVVVRADAAEECGNLGIMQVPDILPEGVNATNIRQCADHPLGRTRVTPTLTARAEEACETGAPYGCSGGYCWKVCGNGGQWCWTAQDQGFGPWIVCSTYNDCGQDASFACGAGGCSACGCSC